MHANASGGGGGSGGQSWRVPADETLQVGGDKESKAEQASFVVDISLLYLSCCSHVDHDEFTVLCCFYVVGWLFINLIYLLLLQKPTKHGKQDLYGSEGHNWRSIIFSLLVIGFVIAGIVTAIYLLG